VTLADVFEIAGRFGVRFGDPRYAAKYDLNGDGRINIVDVAIALSQLGTRCRQ
jgi:hypothetical protein